MINTGTYILPGMFFTCMCQLNDMDTKSVTPVSSITGDHVVHAPARIIFFNIFSVSNILYVYENVDEDFIYSE